MNKNLNSPTSKIWKGIEHIRRYGIVSFLQRLTQYFSGTKSTKLSRYQKLEAPDSYTVGSEFWLMAMEKHFGGIATNVVRRKVSDFDPRSPQQIAKGGMTGGDRMFHHDYGRRYAKHLERFVPRRDESLTIVEAGILRGTGLALWSKLFPKANLIGLDIDLSHFNDNLNSLKSAGAFADTSLELHIFDQFLDNTELMGKILNGRKIDIMIDDGYHSNETIIKTAQSMKIYFANSFVYFVEDNADVFDTLKSEFSNHRHFSYGELSVIER